MKLEIRNNYDGELAEARGIVSTQYPVMGVLIGNDRLVWDVKIAKTVEDLLGFFGVVEYEDKR
jgi:uncharacterized membrane protein